MSEKPVTVEEQIATAETWAKHFDERADWWGDNSAAMRMYRADEHDAAAEFRAIAANLRRVAALERVAEAVGSVLNKYGRTSRGMVTIEPEEFEAMRDSIAALDEKEPS